MDMKRVTAALYTDNLTESKLTGLIESGRCRDVTV